MCATLHRHTPGLATVLAQAPPLRVSRKKYTKFKTSPQRSPLCTARSGTLMQARLPLLTVFCVDLMTVIW